MSAVAEKLPSKEAAHKNTLLFVDDERNVLTALRRMFRPLGYRVLMASGGEEAIAVLQKIEVDVIVADMRMPKMSGTELLAQAAERWPHTLRILLTGYSDIASAVQAIKEGHIHRYLNKPWNDEDLKLMVAQAMEHRHLVKEKALLVSLAREQNRELKGLSESLEGKVNERTAELVQAADMLRGANDRLKHSYASAVQVFANLLPARSGPGAEQLRMLAQDACELGACLGLEEEELENLRFAALLSEIGKLMLSDELLSKSYAELDVEELKRFHEHPVAAETTLLPLEPLETVAAIIRAHCERFDGKGFPDQIAATDIVLEARILAVVKDHAALIAGRLLPESLSSQEARSFLEQNRGQRYDAEVVDKFLEYLDSGASVVEHLDELKLTVDNLRESMVLTRDLMYDNGILILTKGQALTPQLIAKVKMLTDLTGRNLSVYVKPAT